MLGVITDLNHQWDLHQYILSETACTLHKRSETRSIGHAVERGSHTNSIQSAPITPLTLHLFPRPHMRNGIRLGQILCNGKKFSKRLNRAWLDNQVSKTIDIYIASSHNRSHVIIRYSYMSYSCSHEEGSSTEEGYRYLSWYWRLVCWNGILWAMRCCLMISCCIKAYNCILSILLDSSLWSQFTTSRPTGSFFSWRRFLLRSQAPYPYR